MAGLLGDEEGGAVVLQNQFLGGNLEQDGCSGVLLNAVVGSLVVQVLQQLGCRHRRVSSLPHGNHTIKLPSCVSSVGLSFPP